MNLIRESELQATIIEIFEAVGRQVFHVGDSRKEVRDGDRYALVGDAQAAGYPDLTIAGGGEVIWAELKSTRGRLEPEQVEWLDALPPHQAYIWQPKDLDVAAEIAGSGHPADGRTCWTCHRDAIIKRIGVKQRKSPKTEPASPRPTPWRRSRERTALRQSPRTQAPSTEAPSPKEK